MSSAAVWKKAGFSVNKYLTISARTLQKALKSGVSAEGAKKYETELKVQTIKDGEVVKNFDLENQKELQI